MFDWSHLRFFLAVAHGGSTVAAARTLGVNQSTVQRRIGDLERELGQRLFERLPSGYRLNDLGRAMVPAAEQVADAAGGFVQALSGATRKALGVVRLTCPEPIALRLSQSGLLERFSAAHRDLSVEFVLSDHYVDLSKGEADVALRSGDTEDSVLVGRTIAQSLWAVYVSGDYVARRGGPASPAEMAAHPLIGFEESMRAHRTAVWLSDVAPDATYAARTTSVLGLVHAAKAGVGVAPLPTALGDAEPDLVRMFGPVDPLTRDWRILAHPDQRQTRRVAAFFAFAAAESTALRKVLTG